MNEAQDTERERRERRAEQLTAYNEGIERGRALGQRDTLRLVYIGAACSHHLYFQAANRAAERHRAEAVNDVLVQYVLLRDIALSTLRALADLGDEAAIEMLGGAR